MRYKLRIKVSFIDKYTVEVYPAGEVVDFDEKRGEELLADPRDLVELVEKTGETKKRTTRKKAEE